MTKHLILAAFVSLFLVLAACTTEVEVTREVQVIVTPEPGAAAAPRELTLLVGAGEDTLSVNAFLPAKVTVRVGDTVTWKINHTGEVHTTSFLSGGQRPPPAMPIAGGGPTDLQIPPEVAFPSRAPGAPVETYDGTGVVSSGVMANVSMGPPGSPPNDSFTLNFDTPGTYEYVCLLHPPMKATITVVDANVEDVPSQADIDAMAQAEEAPLRAQIERIVEAGQKVRTEPGPNDTTIWYVQAGAGGWPATAQSFDFLAKDITIQEGDTVVWESEMFHNVTFHPGRQRPDFIIPKPQDQGPPIISLNPEVVFPHKPAGVFDGTGFWSSGIIGIDTMPLPGGKTFSMTFGKAGTFKYVCAIHEQFGLGMVGSVTVTPKEGGVAMGAETIPSAAPIPAIAMGPAIPQDKGYLVEELGDGLYWVTNGTYQAMFLTTGEGVIAVDAPPSIGENYLKAIAEVTNEPVTHVIYSHSHADHIAAASMFPKDAVYIAHEDTATQLARPDGPERTVPFGTFVGGSPVPTPTVTFSKSYTLTVGNQTLELEYKGPQHNRGNIFIYAPKQKVLLLIDVVFPGWSPFLKLALAEDVPAFIQSHDDILSYDFDVLVSGHLGRQATREDVETQREYVLDMQANAAKALQTVDFMAVAQKTGFDNPWLLFGTYLDNVAQECAKLTLTKWAERLGGADLFTSSHCAKLMNSLRLD
ncbi:MAG: MBL fold metallo-hydrolase [Chloroflexi bacterium]|nr:MBL fold metallo-hydrolase [Chloroflexota bacterium]